MLIDRETRTSSSRHDVVQNNSVDTNHMFSQTAIFPFFCNLPISSMNNTTVLPKRKKHPELGGLRVTTPAWSYRFWCAALIDPFTVTGVPWTREWMHTAEQEKTVRLIHLAVEMWENQMGWNAAARETLFCFVSVRELQRDSCWCWRAIESTSVKEKSEFEWFGSGDWVKLNKSRPSWLHSNGQGFVRSLRFMYVCPEGCSYLGDPRLNMPCIATLWAVRSVNMIALCAQMKHNSKRRDMDTMWANDVIQIWHVGQGSEALTLPIHYTK